MAVENYLLTQNGIAGAYWATLPITNPNNGGNYKERYGDSISGYRVYSNMYDLRIYLYDNINYTKSIRVEIQGNWLDTSAHYLPGGRGAWEFDGYFSMEFTTKVNGIRDQDSFHHGMPGSGWRWISPINYFKGFSSIGSRVTVDGVEAGTTYLNTGAYCFKTSGSLCTTIKCIASGAPAGTGFEDNGKGNLFAYNIAKDLPTGFRGANYNGNGSIFANNLATGCGIGFVVGTSPITNKADFVNNISIGNTTNWGTAGAGYSAKNAGATGDVIWTSAGETNITGITAADFVDFAGGNFSIAVSSSPLINVGTEHFDLLPSSNIKDAVVPNYESATYPNNLRDIGPFEFDHGEGLAPIQVPISISGMSEGSVLAIYKTSDDLEIIAPTTIGASGVYSTTFSYTGDISITVKVRKGTSGIRYLSYEAPGLITSDGYSLIVNQVEDTIAELI